MCKNKKRHCERLVGMYGSISIGYNSVLDEYTSSDPDGDNIYMGIDPFGGQEVSVTSLVPFDLYSRPAELKADMDTSGFGTDSIDSSEIVDRHKKRFGEAWKELADR